MFFVLLLHVFAFSLSSFLNSTLAFLPLRCSSPRETADERVRGNTHYPPVVIHSGFNEQIFVEWLPYYFRHYSCSSCTGLQNASPPEAYNLLGYDSKQMHEYLI